MAARKLRHQKDDSNGRHLGQVPRSDRTGDEEIDPGVRIIGIDGEGQGRRPHRYTLLSACDATDGDWTVESRGQLTTRQCLDFILGLPGGQSESTLIFGFAFLYDLTKILRDLPDRAIYLLFHEERRAAVIHGTNGDRVVYRPIVWQAPGTVRGLRSTEVEASIGKVLQGPTYTLNYMNRRFEVSTGHKFSRDRKDLYTSRVIQRCRRCQLLRSEHPKQQRAVVWDIFAFFQAKYTKALTDWFSEEGEGKIWKLPRMGEAVKRMELMKAQRAQFDKLTREEIRAYCKEECRYLASLGAELINAHKEAGLTLKTYFGAGSTASSLLTSCNVKEYRGDIPLQMREPVACAFFGGRFENSVIGPIRGRVYDYDISSAYPYQATFLPCLLCGRWRHHARRGIDDAIARSTLSLVRWHTTTVLDGPWGVLPVRKAEGTIAFPLAGEGGWVWKEEFLAAQKVNQHVEVVEAWNYHTSCEHRPFAKLPEIYRERVRIGKDARGIVLKLGPNSVYGKLAQSKGINPPFQSWVWAGNITSGCRGQLLDLLRRHRRREDCLMFATDGVWTREKLLLPSPRDSGTSDLAKPLGGWEEKVFERGVFAVRPGIYFPLEPTDEELEKVRARGLGRKALYEQWQLVVDAWERGDKKVSLKCADRFVGAKSGVRWSKSTGAKRSDDYGEWIPHSVDVGFDPRPKRSSVNADGTLNCWRRFDVESVPYDPATMSAEAQLLIISQRIAEEQPDGDFSELE